MEEEEVLKEIEKVSKQIEKFKASLGDKISKEDLEKVTASVEALTKNFKTMEDKKVDETVKEIKITVDKFQTQMEEIKAATDLLKEGGSSKRNAHKSFGAQVVEALKAAKHLDKPFSPGEHRTIELKDFDGARLMVNKTAAAMTTANVDAVGSGSIPYELADFESGLTRIQRRTPWILAIANTSPTTKKYVQWAEQENQDGTPVATAEGVGKPLIDFDWVEKSKPVEKYPAYIKISTEMLDDLDGIQNEIDMELTERILLAVDADLLSGTGVSPILSGILSMDTAYASGSLAATVLSPGKSDVLRAAIAQVTRNLFKANYILLHPDDVASMDLEKDSEGRYLLPPFKSANGMIVSGVQILENTGQTAGSFTVGDFTKLNVRIRKGMTIDMGLDGNDFTLNLITIRGEMRLASYIKSNHAGAFVSGTFAAAITELTLVP